MIFDLDGTLLNTLEDLAASTNAILEARGYNEHPLESYKRFVGNGAYKLVERALPTKEAVAELVEAMKDEFLIYYDAHLMDYAKPYEGIVELLHELKHADITMAIATNKPHIQAVKLAKAYFGSIDWLEIAGNQEGLPHKPNPYTVNQIIAKAGVKQEEVLYIGDSDVDMQTAQNAGVCGIGVSWGFRTEEELMAHGAHVVVHHPKEILKYLN